MRSRPGYERAVDAFSEEMKAKLRKKAHEGYGGWDKGGESWFFERLREHVARGPSQAVDIANFAMMVWRARERRIAFEAKSAQGGKDADSPIAGWMVHTQAQGGKDD